VACKLANALYERRDELEDISVWSAQITQALPLYTDPNCRFRIKTFLAGPMEREAGKQRRLSYVSLHLSQIERTCHEVMRPDVALLEVSPPDEYGYMSLGAFGPAMHDAVRRCAKTVLLQVNPQVPVVYGKAAQIHVSDAQAIVEAEDTLAEAVPPPFDDVMTRIADYVVEEVPDGATIQLGLGGLSNAIGYRLTEKNDLGIHTEMFSDSMMNLVRRGVVTNRRKNYMTGKAVVGFAYGSQELYRFLHHNRNIFFAPYSCVNNVNIIAQNDNMISINTAMSIDLYGQVAAENLGGLQQSGTGGQVDFVRGAQLSKGGKSLIVLPSTLERSSGTISRIVSAFPPATAITTSRQDVHYVVTEYGKVNLRELDSRERAQALIALAHPNYREQLTREAQALGIF
jgi:4-hydroxybutyrate CoA-transferase